MNYVGLHVHTHFSLFDGVATPEEYVDRAVELGMPAIAITDHGTLSGHRELHRIAKAKGIKPILGLEGYMCADISDTRDKSEREGQQDLVYNHIVLLAKNQIGLENLNKISEIGVIVPIIWQLEVANVLLTSERRKRITCKSKDLI